MCTRIAILLLLLAGAAREAPAGPLEAWFARDDALLVVVLLDGLVPDFAQERAPDGSLLMPRLQDWTRAAIAFTDVLAIDTNAEEARRQLRVRLGGFGGAPQRWIRSGEGNVDEALAASMADTRRGVLVLDLDWLEPPLEFDREIAARLDPAPWDVRQMKSEIETRVAGRISRALRLATLRSRANSRFTGLSRDLRWVVGATHATIDARLGDLLDAVADPRVGVLLTATSSTAMGAREAVGPGMGAGLDVARVPVLLRVPAMAGGVDPRPRQWIGVEPGWFSAGPAGERFTWSSPTADRPGHAKVCELRWTTRDFTLLDSTEPRRPPRVFDRRLDPGEWLDRGIEYPALADSLKRALRSRLYGAAPVLVFQAGESPTWLSLSSPGPLECLEGRELQGLILQPGESVRVRLAEGAENVELGQAVVARIGGREFRISRLTVHAPAWRALVEPPGPGPGLSIRIE